MQDEPLVLKSARDVAYRALCLSALQLRTDIEIAVQKANDAESVSFHRSPVVALNEWLDEEGLRNFQSPTEERLFSADLGSWSQRDVVNSSWRQEALGTLLWSLGRLDKMPPYDSQFTGDIVAEELMTMNRQGVPIMNPANVFVMKAQLRSADEIAKERETAELWHWRARTSQLQRQNKKLKDSLSYEEAIHGAAESAVRSGMLPKTVAGDFPAFEKAFAKLTRSEFSRVFSIAVERHFALNWICGYSEDWDSTPTDT